MLRELRVLRDRLHTWHATVRDGDARLLGPEDTLDVRDLGLFYSTDGKLWRARWSRWEEDAEGVVSGFTYDRACEFQYAGPRQRYWARELDPQSWSPLPVGSQGTTYLGELPWSDFEVNGSLVATAVRGDFSVEGVSAQQDAATGKVEFFPDEPPKRGLLTAIS